MFMKGGIPVNRLPGVSQWLLIELHTEDHWLTQDMADAMAYAIFCVSPVDSNCY